MATATIRSVGRVGVFALAMAAGAAQAFENVEFIVSSDDKALINALRAASLVLSDDKGKQTNTQDILTDGRAEYANLLNALYARGHYSAVIHVYGDGREVAAIPPLDAPASVSKIKVTVDPGPRFTLSQARVQPLPRRADLPDGFRAGQPAESGVIIGAAAAGVDAWRAQGHAKARVSGQDLVANHPKAQLSADIMIDPGPRLRFGRLKVQGQERMREARIRAITGLPEGDVYDPKEMDRATARLRRTGVFKSATLSEDETITQPDLLGITATVVEQKTRRYKFGAEIASQEGLTLSGSWLHRNLFGGAERFEVTGEVSQIGSQVSRPDYVLGVSLDRPATFTPDTNLGFDIEIGRLDETDFRANVLSVSASLTHVFSDSLTGRAGLAYDYAAIRDQIGDFTYRELSLPIGLTWDRRDNKTDAKDGFYIDAEVKPFLGFANTDNGVRAKLDLRGYKAFGDEKRFVLAARVQAGAIYGASVLGAPRGDLFYSGGSGTVRGQPYQSLGINLLRSGIATQIGGTQFAGASIEARVKATETWGVVGFVDVGRIDVDGFFATSGDWHAGAGLGVRYATGVGPIRLDVAAPVRGDTGSGAQFYIGLGQSF